MPACKVHDELALLGDSDRQAKKMFLSAYVETLGDELQATRQSGLNPLDVQYFKSNDEGFVALLKQLKSQMAAGQAKRTRAVNSLADSMRSSLKAAGLYSELLEPQVEAYADIQYDLQVLAAKRSSPFYDPLSGNSASPLERLTKERRAELQTVLKALGLTASKPQAPHQHADIADTIDPLALLK